MWSQLKFLQQLLLAGVGAMSFWAWLLFGFDKWRAKQGRWRVPEFSLLLVSLLGGWPGGLLGMVFFHHKSRKGTFLLQFTLVALVGTALMAGLWAMARR